MSIAIDNLPQDLIDNLEELELALIEHEPDLYEILERLDIEYGFLN